MTFRDLSRSVVFQPIVNGSLGGVNLVGQA